MLTPEGAMVSGRVLSLPIEIDNLAITEIGSYLSVTGLSGKAGTDTHSTNLPRSLFYPFPRTIKAMLTYQIHVSRSYTCI